MNKVELNDQTLDSYDVLRKELREKFEGFMIMDFLIQKNGSISICMEKWSRGISGRMVCESRYITATFKRGKWTLKGDID